MDQAVTVAPAVAQDEGAVTLLRFTVEQVGAMLDAGVFSGVNHQVELRKGLLHRTNAQAAPHLKAKTTLLLAIHEALRNIASPLRIDAEGSVRVDEHNLPVPDLIVWDDLRTRGFVPVERVRLLVEICNTTHAGDFGTKPGLYAAGGVPEYWIVDLPGRAIHQRWAPENGGYRQARVVAFGEAVTAATLPGVVVPTAALLDIEPA